MSATLTTMTLADQLAAAEAAVVEPRQRASRLEIELSRAVELGEYVKAEGLKNDLRAATEELVIAEAAVRAVGEGAARAEQARAAADRQIAEARQRDQVQRELAEAIEAEQDARAQLADATEAMYGAIETAQRCMRAGLAAEVAVGSAQARQLQARAHLTGAAAPRAPGCNQLSALVGGRDQLGHDLVLSQLRLWSR